MRERNPAWRLLRADNAVLFLSLLYRVFPPNVRVMGAPALIHALEDEYYALAEAEGRDTTMPRPAIDYLNDWATPEKGWLRSYYKQGTDEQQFEPTAATEKVLSWLSSFSERTFVGTESGLKTVFDLLRQIAEGTEADPAKRLIELRRKREEIDAEISRVVNGQVALLDDVAVQDRFQQIQRLARNILTDFREVESNLRKLDRQTREKIASWDGSKGELLDEVMGERDAIADSDQGRNFQAFWGFLLASDRQEELSRLLERVVALPAVVKLGPDERLAYIHNDWLEAGKHTQRTVAQLSKQLRRFLDDQALAQSRRILELLRNIETSALTLREAPPEGPITEVIAPGALIRLRLERPLFHPSAKITLPEIVLDAEDEDIDASALFNQVVVDTAALRANLHRLIEEQAVVTLRDAVAARPLEHGLAELVAYLQFAAGKEFDHHVDESSIDEVSWRVDDGRGGTVVRRARMHRIIFVRHSCLPQSP